MPDIVIFCRMVNWQCLDYSGSFLTFLQVNKPGFLRLIARLMPNFKVGSDKRYRDMLDPAYNSIKKLLKEKLVNDAPPTVAVGLDPWSQVKHMWLTESA